MVNTGDDFNHLGLRICPDVDTVCYTLAGLANPVTGWGRIDETWTAFDQLVRLGGPDWFRLGDKDFATHLERTRRLEMGETLSQITADFCKSWGIEHRVMPMTDQPVSTWVDTVEFGWLPFQEYFVRHACEPRVKGFDFRGRETARPAPRVLESIQAADYIIVCPSNPWVSIDPIIHLEGVLDCVMHRPVRAAVSPIIGGKTIKGPAAKMYRELGVDPSALAVARHYQSWLNGYVFDEQDAQLLPVIAGLGIEAATAKTVMNSTQDRIDLAKAVLDFCLSLQQQEAAL